MSRRDVRTVRSAFLATIPVMAGYLVLGMGFGIILESKGYGVLWAFAMSLLIYAGSMQYLAVDLMTAGASLITTALTTLMVNARHLFYGISAAEKYRGAGKRKPYMIFALTDETYSLVCGGKLPAGVNETSYYFYISLFDHIYWVAGSVAGSVLGKVLPFSTEGVDFALTALFVTIFTEQWMSTHDHTAAVIGVGSSVSCLIIFGADSFLIPSMIVISLLLTAVRFWKRRAS